MSSSSSSSTDQQALLHALLNSTVLDLVLAARAESTDDARCESLLHSANNVAEQSSASSSLGNVLLIGINVLFSMLRLRQRRNADADVHTQRAVELLDDATRHALVVLDEHMAALAGHGNGPTRLHDTIDLLAEVQAHLLAANEAASRPAWWLATDVQRRPVPAVLRQVRQCTALVDHVATNPKMLSFRAGETFAILSRHSSLMYKARHKQRVGLVPCAAVTLQTASVAGDDLPSSTVSTPRSVTDEVDPDTSSAVESGDSMSSSITPADV
jgi:hypothetical protein